MHRLIYRVIIFFPIQRKRNNTVKTGKRRIQADSQQKHWVSKKELLLEKSPTQDKVVNAKTVSTFKKELDAYWTESMIGLQIKA